MEPHTAITPDAIKWETAPPALPPGAQAAVLYGDPSKEGVFAMRLKMPKGYQIPPHTHPRPEIVTIISGEGLLGMGEKADS
jgi:quercetin dioxygenase-like cupin family protein